MYSLFWVLWSLCGNGRHRALFSLPFLSRAGCHCSGPEIVCAVETKSMHTGTCVSSDYRDWRADGEERREAQMEERRTVCVHIEATLPIFTPFLGAFSLSLSDPHATHMVRTFFLSRFVRWDLNKFSCTNWIRFIFTLFIMLIKTLRPWASFSHTPNWSITSLQQNAGRKKDSLIFPTSSSSAVASSKSESVVIFGDRCALLPPFFHFARFSIYLI